MPANSIIEIQYEEDPATTVVRSNYKVELPSLGPPSVYPRYLSESTTSEVPADITQSTTAYGAESSTTTFIPSSSNTTDDSSHELVSGGASDHHSYTIIMLTYLFYAISLATLVHFLIKRLPTCIRPPYAVTLFGLGAFLSYLHRTASPEGWSIFSESIGYMENVNPEIVFFVILPPLLFESGMGLNWHVFRRLMWSAFILAFPGVVLNLFFIGIFAFISFGPGWSLPISLLLGSMLSTTDPVAVVAALHSLHAPEKLAILIEGESLLNDGSAIAGVLIFQNMVETDTFSILKIFELLFRCAIGGCLFGIGFAGLQVLSLRIINKLDHAWPEIETAIVVGGVYLCYLLSDLMHMSGIISVVSLAISMAVFGRGAFSPNAETSIHAVVKQLSYFANQLIWLIGGHMTTAQLSQSDVASDPVNWIRMVALFLMLNIARGISTWIMFPTLARMGYGLNLKETIMLIYAGLRGALCISLALMVRKSKNISSSILNEMGFYVAGAVMLTIVINGSTIELLYRYLEIYPKKTWARIQMQRSVAQVDAREEKYVEALKTHWFFKSANLQIMKEILPNFSKAEFNTQTGEVHVPMESVKNVMNRIMDRYDAHRQLDSDPIMHDSTLCDNGFLYSDLRIKEPALDNSVSSMYKTGGRNSASSTLNAIPKGSSSNSLVDRLIRVVQLSDTRIKSVAPEPGEFEAAIKNFRNILGGVLSEDTIFSLFQSCRSVSEFLTARTEANPFADGSAGGSMEFSVTLPEMGIHQSLYGSKPNVLIGLGPKTCTHKNDLTCGLYTDSREIFPTSAAPAQGSRSEFRRDFVRGDIITVVVTSSPLRITYMCGRYFIGECTLDENIVAADLYPTVIFLVPEEQAELSFQLCTTTSAETLTESYAYILNAAICLYEDLFKAGTINAASLLTLNDSVQYGIDAANDDLEVKSMRKRIRDVKSIYTRDRGKVYEVFDEPEDRLSPLETEWGFLHLRHMKRLDCNDPAVYGFLVRLGEFLGIRTQYRKTLRKVEELLAYNAVHSDLISHSEMLRFPDTRDLIARLVLTAKSYMLCEVYESSPRDFHIAQHILAARILLNIRRKILEEFAKEGSLSIHSVHELDEMYITKQLLALESFTPRLSKNASILSVFTPPARKSATLPIHTAVTQKNTVEPAVQPTFEIE